MQKRKKQLLGLAGLVLVGAITAIACAIPTPGASAADDVWQSGVGISVTVEEDEGGGETPSQGKTSVKVSTINGMDTSAGQITTVKKKVQFKVTYQRADEVTVKVTDAEGRVVTAKCQGVSYSATSQTCTAEVELDSRSLAKDPQNGDKLKVTAVATRTSTGTTIEDAVEFIYRSAYIYTKGEYEEKTNNPIIYAVANSDVKYAMIQVFDAAGNAVFKQPITFNYGDVDPATGLYKIVLPFKENNLPAGKYTAVLMAYSTATPSEDSLIAVSTVEITYSSDGSPLPPDTGSNLFGNLNISRADYILTGLIAFGMVTVFAIFLIVRRNKR